MGIDFLLGSVFQVARHDLKDDRNESNFAPSVTLEYDLNEDTLTYLNWSKGFKSGGYDVRSNAPDSATTIGTNLPPSFQQTVAPGSFEYGEEEAQTLELGIKTTLFDGAGELNVAWFYTEYEDLQVSIYDGVLGFNVGNAAEATTQGVEIDGRVMVTENLTLSAAVAWMDFEFDEYKNGQCTQQQRIDNGGIPVCDVSGSTNQYVAEWSGVVSADHNANITDNLVLRTTVDVVFSSDYNPSQTVDPLIEQGGYYKLNARLALGDVDGIWDVALVGKNLTDEDIITYANDTPLSANLIDSVGFYAFTEPGRTIAVQGTYRF
jgi:outer membrane receptor protein involved in Fe transport